MAPSTRKDGSNRKDNSPLFADAPTQLLKFPQDEPITICEIMALNPNWIRNHDIAFRMASNGVSNQTLETMVNYYRDPSSKGKVGKNSICKMMQKPMRAKGIYKFAGTKTVEDKQVPADLEWTISLHQSYDIKNRIVGQVFDPTDLCLTKMTPDLGTNGTLVDNIPFASLAVGVKRFPSVMKGDGLNLTRCVQYASVHPEENWMFPGHFKLLIKTLGRQFVQPYNYDGEVFRRWNNGRTPFPLAPLIPSARRLSAERAAAAAAAAQINAAPTVPVAVAAQTNAAPTVPVAIVATQPAPGFPNHHLAAQPHPAPHAAQPAIAIRVHNQGILAQAPGYSAPAWLSRGVASTPSSRPAIAKWPTGGVKKSRKTPNKSSLKESSARLEKLQRTDTTLLRNLPEVEDHIQPHSAQDPSAGFCQPMGAMSEAPTFHPTATLNPYYPTVARTWYNQQPLQDPWAGFDQSTGMVSEAPRFQHPLALDLYDPSEATPWYARQPIQFPPNATAQSDFAGAFVDGPQFVPQATSAFPNFAQPHNWISDHTFQGMTNSHLVPTANMGTAQSFTGAAPNPFDGQGEFTFDSGYHMFDVRCGRTEQT